MIAVVSPSRTSTSGRAKVGMKPCTKALYVSLINRCDSAAIVAKTSELLPEPEMPVNTVSRRFGISTLTSWRLLTRAPCTRIRSWVSAGCVALLIGTPLPAGRGRAGAATRDCWSPARSCHTGDRRALPSQGPAPDRDVALALGGERGPVPVRPAGLGLQPG